MFGLAEVEAGRDEFLGAQDPAALAAIAPADVFAARLSGVADRVVVIAPRDAIGVGDVVGRGGGGGGGIGGGDGPDLAVVARGESHLGQKALEDLHRIGARVHIHVEDARLKHGGQAVDPRFMEVMAHEDRGGVIDAEHPEVVGVGVPVPVDVDPEPAQRREGDAPVRHSPRIVGVVHEAALAGDDFPCDVLDGLHGGNPQMARSEISSQIVNKD
ncbi:MAG: hypothetical protein RL123_1064 [Pseudomonadota bacterium]